MDVVILAAGCGKRMNVGYNKVFIKINGHEVLWHTVKKFNDCSVIDNIIVVTGSCDMAKCMEICQDFDKVTSVILGGETRQQSSYNGLLASSAEFVLIHDAARPLISDEDIIHTAEMTKEYGAAAVGVKCVDTLKTYEDGFISGTVDRSKIIKIYTPQGFNREMLIELNERAFAEDFLVTDDSSLCEHYGVKVKFVEGNPSNIKLTTSGDLDVAEALLQKG